MAEKKTGAGLHLASVLERSAPPEPPASPSSSSDTAEGESTRGRGGRRSAPRVPGAKKIKGRTIYIPDDLFERVMVQAHRRDKTISEYVASILERQVPDHRMIVGDSGEDAA